MVPPNRDEIPVEKLNLCQDDFIEWVLSHTKEETEFRIYQTEHYVIVGIDRDGKVTT